MFFASFTKLQVIFLHETFNDNIYQPNCFASGFVLKPPANYGKIIKLLIVGGSLTDGWKGMSYQ